MPAPEKPDTARIAITFGNPLSISAKKPPRPPPSSLGKRQRPSHGLGGNSDSESDDESHTNGRHERITAFGVNGAELAKSDQDRRDNRDRAKRGPLTIERQPNRDWKAEARARNQHDHRQSAAAGTPGTGNQKVAGAADEAKPIRWGLTITKKTPAAETEGNEHKDETPKSQTATPDEERMKHNAEESNTAAEKEAVKALLGQTINDRTKTQLVIHPEVNNLTEDDIFSRDFSNAPDASTLEDYEAMPVDEFGAALLRGMGWDGKDRGPKVKQVVRRPNQMGLGAKELKSDEDLGAWNHKSSSSSTRNQRPQRLHEYRREEEQRREKREERYGDSYKRERDRERDARRSGGHSGSSGSRHHSRQHR